MLDTVRGALGDRAVKILAYLGAAIALTFIAMWIWRGGYIAVARYAGMIPTPLSLASQTGYDFELPGTQKLWTVPDTTTGPDDHEYGRSDYQTTGDQLVDLQAQYDELQREVEDARSFGEPSPYRGKVAISGGTAGESDPRNEYIVISMQWLESGSISLAGWSLQSQLSGQRAIVPLAASPLIQGTVNTIQPITLFGGQSVIVMSGPSPVGISFRENICTGYLEALQQFQPTLSNACPSPKDAMPLTAFNIQKYGAECSDFVATIPQCSAPATVPSTISPACRTFIANTFTYNGCVSTFRLRVPFNLDTWRAYIGSNRELWSNTHDVIRLLDDRGRTVDSVAY
ncbi:hypothetical protein HY970_03330 [Candidatus Kaiserbacteria bacterium]|nr:hypothetical protein [Candidatus Kaiserbacteria bacterium]